MSLNSKFECEVLVVGAGPVGLALAGDLGWRGRDCLLIDRGDGAITQPKMDMVGIRTMEFCRRWGLVPEVEASAYNRDYPQDNVYLTSLTGYELGRQPMPSMAADVPPAESPQKRERCPQNMFDPILRRFVERQPSTQLRYGHKLLSFQQDATGVNALIERQDGQGPLEVRAHYLVACDGGRSRVRESLGIGMDGKGLLTHTVNVVFRCPDFNAIHDKAPGYRYMFVGAEGTFGTIVAINGHDQWRMSIIGNAQERRELNEQEIRQHAWRMVGKTFDFEILSVLNWTRSELVAQSYRQGRVFLAGDACHLTSPTGGLGMNTGIGDAVDLSWKLSACLEGWGGEALLASYELERRPVAKRITQFSTGNLMIMKQVPVSADLLEPGAAGQASRQVTGTALGEGLKREWFSANMHLGNRYLASPVCVYTEAESEADQQREYDDAVNYRPSTRPGCRAPHVRLDDGSSTLDAYGRGFVLMALGTTDEAQLAQAAAQARRLELPLTIVRHAQEAVIKAYELPYVLVRPDGHVSWRGEALGSGFAQVLAIACGQGSPRQALAA